jgi:hypothetical protein
LEVDWERCMAWSTFKTSVSHGFAFSSSQAMCRVTNDTKPGLIWEKPEYPKVLDTLATQADQGLRMSGQASEGSMPCDHGTKDWSHLGKILCSTNVTEWGHDLGHQRLQMLYELSAWRPQSWALSSELFGEKYRLPEQTSNYDSYARWLRMSESKRLCRHLVLASLWAKPLLNTLWAKPLLNTLSKVKFLI